MKAKTKFQFGRAAWAVTLTLGLAAAILCLRVATSAPVPSAAVKSPRPAGDAGMVVSIDKESGSLVMPSAEDMARLNGGSGLTPVSSARPAPVYHPNGSISMDVRSWMIEYSVVRLSPDGKPLPYCVSGEDQKTQILDEAPAPAGLEER